jgi:hypothetical protein
MIVKAKAREFYPVAAKPRPLPHCATTAPNDLKPKFVDAPDNLEL